MKQQEKSLEIRYRKYFGRSSQTGTVDRTARRYLRRSLSLLVNVEALHRRAGLGLRPGNNFLSGSHASQEMD